MHGRKEENCLVLMKFLSPFLSPPSSLQTYIGSILSAVNPYKVIEGVYGQEMMEKYMDRQLGDLSPHIYAIANEVYVSMWRMRHNQCVLIRYVCEVPPLNRCLP